MSYFTSQEVIILTESFIRRVFSNFQLTDEFGSNDNGAKLVIAAFLVIVVRTSNKASE